MTYYSTQYFDGGLCAAAQDVVTCIGQYQVSNASQGVNTKFARSQLVLLVLHLLELGEKLQHLSDTPHNNQSHQVRVDKHAAVLRDVVVVDLALCGLNLHVSRKVTHHRHSIDVLVARDSVAHNERERSAARMCRSQLYVARLVCAVGLRAQWQMLI